MSAFPSLKVILSNDLLPWERELFRGTVNALRLQFAIEEAEFIDTASHLKHTPSPVWFISRSWKQAVRQTRDWPADVPVLITVIEASPQEGSWHALLWQKWETPQRHQHFLCLSPFTFRFLGEMQGITKSQLHFSPLPFFQSEPELALTTSPLIRPKFKVGMFSRFTAAENLHHAVTVAHYVTQQNPNIEFSLMGYGPLARHLKAMIGGLNLEKNVTVRETTNIAEIQGLDLFLYIPVRNDHFGPLLYAANFGLPVIANELPGIEDFIIEGKTGFIVPPHDTKVMGELILRMEASREMKTGLAQALRIHLGLNYTTAQKADRLAFLFAASAARKETLESIAS